MNEHGKDDDEQQNKKQRIDAATETASLERRLSHFFDAQANQIYLSPERRNQILRQLSTLRQQRRKRAAWTMLAVAVIYIIIFATLLPHLATLSILAIRYSTTKEISVQSDTFIR